MDRPRLAADERESRRRIGFEPGEVNAGEFRRAVRGHLGELLWTVLSTEVVADRLTKRAAAARPRRLADRSRSGR